MTWAPLSIKPRKTAALATARVSVIRPDFNKYRVAIDLGDCTWSDAIRKQVIFTGFANLGVNNAPAGSFINETIEIAISALNPEPSFGFPHYVI